VGVCYFFFPELLAKRGSCNLILLAFGMLVSRTLGY